MECPGLAPGSSVSQTDIITHILTFPLLVFSNIYIKNQISHLIHLNPPIQKII